MPERNASPQQPSAARAAQAQEQQTEAQPARQWTDALAEQLTAHQTAAPAVPSGRLMPTVEPVVESPPDPVAEAGGQVATVVAPDALGVPGVAPAAPAVREPVATPRPGLVTTPLRIIAAAIGVALVAVPFATAALKHAPPPAPKRPAATFRVGDHDVRTFWPVPGAARN